MNHGPFLECFLIIYPIKLVNILRFSWKSGCSVCGEWLQSVCGVQGTFLLSESCVWYKGKWALAVQIRADRVLGPVSWECVEDFTPAGRLLWGNVNSLCGSLGTVFHLPSRNCSNEARHIAFHPSLPAIRHSSQFSLWPQRSVCIHRHNVAGQDCPLLPSARTASRHMPPLVYLEHCTLQGLVFLLPTTLCMLCFCVPPTAQSESPARAYRGRSYGHDL